MATWVPSRERRTRERTIGVPTRLVIAAAAVAMVTVACNETNGHSTLSARGGNISPPGLSPATSAAPRPVTHHVSPAPRATSASPRHVYIAPRPTPTPTPTPAKKTTVLSTCGAPANPWSYNFCGRGSYIYSPAADVCSYFSCIGNFDNGTGYMVECSDGEYSMSGGHSGACSYHGGEDQPVYSGSGPH